MKTQNSVAIWLVCLFVIGLSPFRATAGEKHFAPPPGTPQALYSSGAQRQWNFSAPERSVQYDIGEPTAEEQYMLELVNRARADAWAEADRLRYTDDADVVSAYSYFNVDLAEMERQFKEDLQRSVQPLAMNARLLEAARLHSLDMYNNVFQGHESSSNSISPNRPGDTPLIRIARQGYSAQYYAENIFSYSRSVFYGHAGFNVDWGQGAYGMQNPPGHRETIHNADYYEAGIGIVTGQNSNGEASVGPMLVTQDFATESGGTPFITGVVYGDINSNAFYDIGEGIGSATVTVAGVSYYAVTPESGGYAIPVPDNGEYTVFFSGANIAYNTTTTVTNSENKKLDYVLDTLPLQPPAMLSAAQGMFTNQILAVWSKADGATGYELWRGISTNLAGAAMITGTTSTSYADTNVTAGKTYYYWVRSKKDDETSSFTDHAAGWVRNGPASIVPVYRLYSYGAAESTYEHLWTTSEAERNTLASWPSWQYEEIAWRSYSSQTDGMVPLYRLYAESVRQHHYTIDTNEYAVLSDQYAEWTGEGAQYFVYAGPGNETLPVYRFNHPGLNMHHFTISETEKNTIIGNPDWGYDYEGIAFYVYAPENNSATYRTEELIEIQEEFIVVPGDYTGDGVEDMALYDKSTGAWFILLNEPGSEISRTKAGTFTFQLSPLSPPIQFGGPGFIPVSGDYNDDGVSDMAVFHEETGRWFIMDTAGDILLWDGFLE